MSLSDFLQLKRLTRQQWPKIAAELWDSAAGNDLRVPESHKKLIRSRRSAYAQGKVGIVTMSELKKSIRRRK